MFNGPGSSALRGIKPTAGLGALDRRIIVLLTGSQTMASPRADLANVGLELTSQDLVHEMACGCV